MTLELEKDMEMLKEMKRKSPYPTYRHLDSKLTTTLYNPEKIEWDKVEAVVSTLDDIQILKILEPFWDRKAEINVITMITDDLPYGDKNQENPMNVNFFGTFEGVKKGDHLTIEHPLIYSSKFDKEEGKPEQMICKFLVMESDKKKRYTGDIMEKVRKSEEYKRAIETLIKYPRPEIGLITIATDLVFAAIAKTLEADKDDQMLLNYAGFYKYLHKLGFGEHCVKNDNAILKYSMHLPPYSAPTIGKNEIHIIGEKIT